MVLSLSQFSVRHTERLECVSNDLYNNDDNVMYSNSTSFYAVLAAQAVQQPLPADHAPQPAVVHDKYCLQPHRHAKKGEVKGHCDSLSPPLEQC